MGLAGSLMSSQQDRNSESSEKKVRAGWGAGAPHAQVFGLGEVSFEAIGYTMSVEV